MRVRLFLIVSAANEGFRLLSKEWKRSKDKPENANTLLFFVNIDFSEGGREAFAMVN